MKLPQKSILRFLKHPEIPWDWNRMEASDQVIPGLDVYVQPVKGPVPLSAKCKKKIEQTRLNWMDMGYRLFPCTFWKYQGFIKVLSDLKCMKSHKFYSYVSKKMSKPLPWYLMYLVFSNWFGVFIYWCGPLESFNWLPAATPGDTQPPGMEETLWKLGESVSFQKAILHAFLPLGCLTGNGGKMVEILYSST